MIAKLQVQEVNSVLLSFLVGGKIMVWEYKTLNEMSIDGWELITYTSFVQWSFFWRVEDSGYVIAAFRKQRN